jgi:exonuclease V gamma subunit
MALQLFFSNNVEILGRELVERLLQSWPDPLRPPVLLLPNRYVEKWLKLYISREKGVLMGLYGEFIESFLWRTLAANKSKTGKPALIDGALLTQAILHVMRLIEVSDCGPELRAVREYITAGAEGGRVRRKIGLAARLAGLFLEYEYSRPDLFDSNGIPCFKGLLRSWPERNYFSEKNPTALSMETWQRELYSRAMKAIRDSCADSPATLPGALAGNGLSPDHIVSKVRETGLDQPVFMFGVSGLSLFHRQALLGISRSVDVHVFVLNPCSAFWEDVDTTHREMRDRPGARRNRGIVGELSFDAKRWERFSSENWEEKTIVAPTGDDNRLLSLWGHSGKENIALWCQTVEYQFTEQYADTFGDSVLGEMQRTILFRSNRADNPRRLETENPSSVVVFDAPGIRREVETMRDYILDAMAADSGISPGDIGVYVTDADRYRAALHEALDAYPRSHPLHIPWLMTDEKGSTSLFCKAASDILLLVNGEFSRTRVFSLLRNPLVAASCGVDGGVVAIWENWAVRLNVSHGMDKNHRVKLGEHDPSDQHTWARAFERLLFAGLSDGDMAFEGPAPGPEETIRPFRDIASRERDLCGRFARTVQALFRDVCSIGEQTEWTGAARKLGEVLRAWTCFFEPYADEERIADRYYDGLAMLYKRDELQRGVRAARCAEKPPAFEIEEFLNLATELADFEVPVHTGFCAGKLTVSRIKPSRAIPYKIVYVLGMNEGLFPGSADRDTLDLRTWSHVPGDLRPYRQAQYAFLELLLCASQRLALSFCGRDPAKDAALLPCSTVFELLSFVNEAVLEHDAPLTVTRVPLLAEGEDQLGDGPPAGGRIPPSYNDEAAILLRLRDGPLAPFAQTAQTGAKALDLAAPPAGVVRLSTSQLASFLQNPIEYTLKRSFGLFNEGDTSGGDDTEPFATGGLERFRIGRRFAGLACDFLFGATEGPVSEVLLKGPPEEQWDAFLEQAYRESVIEGGAPEGVFADFDKFDLVPACRIMANTLMEIGQKKHAAGWGFTPSEILQAARGNGARPYVELPFGNNRRLRIASPPHGVFIPPGREGNREILVVNLSDGTTADGAVIRRKYLLEPMLFALAAAAAEGPRYSALFVGFTKGKEDAQAVTFTFDADPVKALALIVRAAESMDDPKRRFDHLPLEIVEDLWMSGIHVTQVSVEERLEENSGDAFGQVYKSDLEILKIVSKEVPKDPECGRLALERFGPLFPKSAGEAANG